MLNVLITLRPACMGPLLSMAGGVIVLARGGPPWGGQ